MRDEAAPAPPPLTAAPPHPEARRTSDPPALSRGATLGRYVIIDVLGRGGMGIVYSAFDTQLERKLALKFVRDDRAITSPESTARLLREAQAMARLSHSNVVSIFDVGAYDERVFLVMEFIEGTSLSSWLETKRPWRETLHFLLQAGDGLAAAHAAGVLHRDFKPDNVLVGKDGRVAVSDFGLAREVPDSDNSSGREVASCPPEGGAESDVPPDSARPPAGSGGPPVSNHPFGARLTAQGGVLGTIGFMAPEQALGRPTSAATDQFSFCVTLYLALYGELPFSAKSLRRYRAALYKDLPPPPAGSKVPGRIRNILVRGLSVDPTERYPSQGELLAALRSSLGVTWRTWAVRLVVVAVLGAVGLAGARATDERLHRCAPDPAEWVGVWDEQVRSESKRAFAAADPVDGADTFEHTAPIIDRWVAEWNAMSGEACRTANIEHRQTPAVYKLRTECLGRRKNELSATSRILREANRKVAKGGIAIASNLELVAWCSDVSALRASPGLPDDPSKRADVLRVRSKIEESSARYVAGDPAGELALADEAVVLARSAGDDAALAEALLRQAGAGTNLGRPASATLPAEREAFFLASGVGADALVVRAASDAALDLSLPKTRDDARMWLGIARAALKRLGGDALLELVVLGSESEILTFADGKPELAVPLAEKRAAAYRKFSGEAHRTALALWNVGNDYLWLSDPARARPFFEDALAMERGVGGAMYVEVGSDLLMLGWTLQDLGEFGEGERLIRQALPIIARGGIETEQTDAFQALARGALAKGEVARAVYEAEQAELHAAHEEVVPILKANADVDLGLALTRAGKPASARSLCEHALAVQDEETAISPDRPYEWDALRCEADALVALGKAPFAIPLIERDLSLPKRVFPADFARVQFSMARALDSAHREPVRAFELATQARQGFARFPFLAFEAREIDAWLDAHRSSR